MGARADREGLSLGYRIMYWIKYAGLTVFGPPQLDGDADPQVRLQRQREAKVAAARKARRDTESS